MKVSSLVFAGKVSVVHLRDALVDLPRRDVVVGNDGRIFLELTGFSPYHGWYPNVAISVSEARENCGDEQAEGDQSSRIPDIAVRRG